MRGLNKEKVASIKNSFVMSENRKSMFKMRHKQKLLRRLAAFAGIAFIIIGILISALVTKNGNLKEKEQELAEAKSTMSELQAQQKESEEELIRLQDDEYIMELARKYYFMSKDGEIIFNIPEENESEQKAEQ
ncbi:FtsB family cell division protein [Domibacillus indicus]|uniref:FtsB family cell division protein n=1 Tax=Domibacillus indicus TaxID=1437523 RepID=UPI000617D205|nr:septum formation initiator family protein [Domibacillus indicus]